MRKLYFFPFLIAAFFLVSCNENVASRSENIAADSIAKGHSGQHHKHQHGDANKHMNENEFGELVHRFEDPARAEWQKPEAVVAFLGDLKGKTVMDIGCGTGYFSFRLLDAGAKVIAADVDDRFLEYVAAKSDVRKLSKDKFQTRKLPYDSPELAAGEVDLVLIVDTYHHIESREAYFSQVKEGLKPNGRLVVIDFKKEESPVGPPKEMRIAPDIVEKELRAAGFSEISLENALLPYQFILVAK